MAEMKVKEYKKDKNPFRLFGDHLAAIGEGIKQAIKPRTITLRYPDQALSLPTNYRGMIRLYKDVCIGCSLCAMICPADAMKMTTWEGKKLPMINYGRCVFCGFCVDVCPVDALRETRVHDAAFTNRRDLIFDPDKFSKDYDEPLPIERTVKKVRAVIDENKVIVYVPDE